MAERLNWKAAVLAGLIAGAVFMMVEMLLVGTVGGESPWGPPRMIAAMAMGEGVLPPPANFDLGVMMAAMLIHFMLSVVLGVVLGLAISRWRMGVGLSLISGLIFGVLIYVVNFYVMTAFFPWFAMARGGISIIAHAVFGLVLGGTYRMLTNPREVERGGSFAA